ncbi:MAG: YqgE/AlgH family protein [Planctomycetaceae bacterium]|nr:YqgE/AlgH family protein [Planctomycetaceae bacterium]
MHDSLRGHYLLASRQLRDGNFFRSAVLLLEHNSEGAMGLIVNRPSSVNVAHALAGHFNVPTSENVIYVGGPVEPSALSMLHNNPAWGDRELSILPGVYIGNSAEAFEAVVMGDEEPSTSSTYRIYSGYSGWGEGQLEAELSRGDWFTLEASAEFVFDVQPYEVWDRLLSEFHKQHRILPIPGDRAEWN